MPFLQHHFVSILRRMPTAGNGNNSFEPIRNTGGLGLMIFKKSLFTFERTKKRKNGRCWIRPMHQCRDCGLLVTPSEIPSSTCIWNPGAKPSVQECQRLWKLFKGPQRRNPNLSIWKKVKRKNTSRVDFNLRRVLRSLPPSPRECVLTP